MITGISVVIVTYKRTSLLSSLLDQLVKQSEIPLAIIVVDNDPDQGAKGVLRSIASRHSEINFKYVSNLTNSLTKGRNLGASYVETEFICLLDDDISIDSYFLQSTSKFLRSLPKAIGVQGMLQLQTRTRLQNLAYFLKGDFYHSRKSCKVRSSISASYPSQYRGSKPLKCEWISGSNQLYKTEVIKKIKWDEKLIAYCDGEDLDHSLRVSSSKLGILYLLPEIKVLHYASEESRANDTTQVLMRELYSYYFLHKLFPNKHSSLLFYAWSRLSQICYLAIKFFAFGFSYDDKLHLRTYVRTLKIVFLNRRSLLKGDLSVANQILLRHNKES